MLSSFTAKITADDGPDQTHFELALAVPPERRRRRAPSLPARSFWTPPHRSSKLRPPNASQRRSNTLPVRSSFSEDLQSH
jgi:hypothetical protein